MKTPEEMTEYELDVLDSELDSNPNYHLFLKMRDRLEWLETEVVPIVKYLAKLG